MVLNRAALEPRKNRKTDVPRTPGYMEKAQAAELHKLLAPLGIITDQLQAEIPTSNLVILCVINAFKGS